MQHNAPCRMQTAGRQAGLMCAGALLVATAAIWGCGSGSDMAPVEGVVRLDSKPLSTGTIYFIPANGRSAAGKIQSDGTFQLSTHSEQDGAQVGTHRVAIAAYEGATVIDYEVDRPQTKSLIPEDYASPDSSGLTFEVKPGITNHAEFDLSSK